jgi:hypothetical protein
MNISLYLPFLQISVSRYPRIAYRIRIQVSVLPRTALGMVLRFITGPAATAAAAAALGLRGDVLRATIIQVIILHQATARFHKAE